MFGLREQGCGHGGDKGDGESDAQKLHAVNIHAGRRTPMHQAG
jgi:hypothetical protein